MNSWDMEDKLLPIIDNAKTITKNIVRINYWTTDYIPKNALDANVPLLCLAEGGFHLFRD